jgi:hypothetical protein
LIEEQTIAFVGSPEKVEMRWAVIRYGGDGPGSKGGSTAAYFDGVVLRSCIIYIEVTGKDSSGINVLFHPEEPEEMCRFLPLIA